MLALDLYPSTRSAQHDSLYAHEDVRCAHFVRFIRRHSAIHRPHVPQQGSVDVMDDCLCTVTSGVEDLHVSHVVALVLLVSEPLPLRLKLRSKVSSYVKINLQTLCVCS